MAESLAKSICFVIDDLTFCGGAHVATFNLIKALAKRGVVIDILTMRRPPETHPILRCVREIRLLRTKVSLVGKLARRIGMTAFGNWPLFQFQNLDETAQWLELHDTVCCISEVSPLRWLVASLGARCRKVQFLHTDYIGWTRFSKDAASVTRFDGPLYSRMDCVGIVGESNARRLKARYPRLAERIHPFYNLIELPQSQQCTKPMNKYFTIVTSGRPNWGPPKKTEFSIEVAAELKRRGCDFVWKVFGSGPASHMERLKKYAARLDVSDCFILAGFTSDIQSEFRAADVTALLSAYEGCANSIYESLLCGVPVIATDVGCASEQIQDGVTGRLLRMDVSEVANAIEYLIRDRNTVERWKQNLIGYKYDNEAALDGLMKLLDV